MKFCPIAVKIMLIYTLYNLNSFVNLYDAGSVTRLGYFYFSNWSHWTLAMNTEGVLTHFTSLSTLFKT